MITIDDISIFYGDKAAVSHVSFEVRPGEIFGLLGPNGAGKTSTLSAIEGLLKPKSGSVVVDGINVQDQPMQAKAKIGVQLQSTSFQSELTIHQIIQLFAGLYGVTLSNDEINNSLQELNLLEAANRRFGQLSGGQQQRVSLYIATIHDPILIILDEPTAGLDPQSRRRLWTRIEGIRDDGRSVLLTTHSMEEAQAVCDRVAIIDYGKILEVDNPKVLLEKYRNDPRVIAASRGDITLEDVFIGLTGNEVRE